MLITPAFVVAKYNDTLIFITAPACERAPFLATVSSQEYSSDVSALTIEELVLAIRDVLEVDLEEIVQILPDVISWQPSVGVQWHKVEDSEYYLRISPFVHPGLTPDQNEYCFFVWMASDNGFIHAPASSLYQLPEVETGNLVTAISNAAMQYQELADEISQWLEDT
jgi:hypothetical protein